METKKWKQDLKKQIEDKIVDAVSNSNTAIAANIGKDGARTSVSSRQRVVQRDGETTIIEERTETKG